MVFLVRFESSLLDKGVAMPPHCHKCGYSSLRTSRWRTSDLLRLILGRLPVRCSTCRERYFVSLRLYLRVRGSRLAGKPA
jgi:predicted Zn-ribbon and HTH transcriptional regulator